MNTEQTTRKMIISGILLIFLGIILGAVAAHALKTAGLADDKISSFETGVRIQMYTGIGLLLLVGIQNYLKFSLKTPVYLLWIGTLLFSGSIYFLSTKTIHGIDLGKAFALITPVGGLLMIIGWGIILMKFITQKK